MSNLKKLALNEQREIEGGGIVQLVLEVAAIVYTLGKECAEYDRRHGYN